jgi:hypothetical protein
MPFAQRTLGEAENLTFNRPFQTYGGQRFAGLNPLQMQGFENVGQLGVTPQMTDASNMASNAGIRSGQMGNYNPATYQGLDVNYLGTQAPSLERFQMTGPQQVNAPSLERFQMSGPERVEGSQFGLASMQPYMSPYMRDVVEQQKQGAIQDYRRQLPGLGAAAARVGGRGGSREALLQSEANRNLNQQLQGIEAAGTQQAFQQGMQQYNVDQAQRMQAQLANQQAGLTAGQTNLQALLGTQQLGAQTGLQAALANQQTGLTTGQTNLQALLGTQQLGAQTGMQSQLANQQAQLQAQQQALGQRQAANQFGEQSRQFGANLGLQGLQQQLAAAGTLGQLGTQQFGQQQQAAQNQLQAGAQLQMQEQQRLQSAYDDFLARQRYPYTQLGFMSDLIRGTPTAGGIQTMYQAPPNAMGQLAGAGLGLAGLYGATRG